MLAIEIDSEAKENRVATEPQILASNHCVLIVEPAPMNTLERPPIWRVSIELMLRDPALGKDPFTVMLPAVEVGPILHRRQIVAFARYPSPVAVWTWFFESDSGRARARVWLHPGQSPGVDCGIFVLPTLATTRGTAI